MRRQLTFALLLVPYATAVAACGVLGAAFVVPDLVFGTVGTAGYVLGLVVLVASLLAIVRTGETLLAIGRELARSRG